MAQEFAWDLLAPCAQDRRWELLRSLDRLRVDATCGNDATFTDDDFPPIESSIGEAGLAAHVKRWGRLWSPVFSSGRQSSSIQQGLLDDCWLLSAMAAIHNHQPLHIQSIVNDEFIDVGAVFVRSFKNGHWRECVIDNALPMRNEDELLFARCCDGSSWAPLLEKAWAKMHTSYSSLSSGTAADALSDLSGGIAELVSLTDLQARCDMADGTLRRRLRAMLSGRSGLVVCSCLDETWGMCMADSGKTSEVVKNHSYAVFDLSEESDEMTLVNPWGSVIPQLGKAVPRLGDGAFTMTMEQVFTFFNTLHICELVMPSPNLQSAALANLGVLEVHGTWSVEDGTAGGHHGLRTFSKNPQFPFRLKRLAHVSMVVYQTEYRCFGRQNKYIPLGIWFAPLTEDRNVVTKEACSSVHVAARQQVLTSVLMAGNYVAVPCSWEASCEGAFTFTILARAPGMYQGWDIGVGPVLENVIEWLP